MYLYIIDSTNKDTVHNTTALYPQRLQENKKTNKLKIKTVKLRGFFN